MNATELIANIAQKAARDATAAMASVLAVQEARRVAGDLGEKRAATVARIDQMESELPEVAAAAQARERAYSEARAALAAMPSAMDWTRADHERHDALLAAEAKARRAYNAGKHAPELARRRIEALRAQVADLDAKIEALKGLKPDTGTLKSLGIK